MKMKKVFASLSALVLGVTILTGCNKEKKIYEVTFTNGSELISQTEYEEGQYILPPDDLPSYTKDAYVYDFTGWYNGDIKFEKGTKVTQNVEYNARFTQGHPCEYTVTYYLYYGKVDSPIYATCPALHGDYIKDCMPENDPAGYTEDDVDYTFVEWVDKDGEPLDEEKTVTSNLEFFATYKPGGPHGCILTYLDHEQKVVGSFSGKLGEVITASLIPMNPPTYTEDGQDYAFDYWKNEQTQEKLVVDETMIDGPMKFVATYKSPVPHQYTATVNFEDGHKSIVNYTADNWSTKRNDIINLVPKDTDEKTYTLDKLVPTNMPSDNPIYNVVENTRYFDYKISDAATIDSHLKFYGRGAGQETRGLDLDTENHLLNYEILNDNFYLGTSVKDFDLSFNIKSADDNRFALVFGLDKNDDIDRGYSGAAGGVCKDGIVGLIIVPSDSTSILRYSYGGNNPMSIPNTSLKVFYNKTQTGITSLANGLHVNIVVRSNIVNIRLNGIDVYDLTLPADYYHGGYIAFARGSGDTVHSYDLYGDFSLQPANHNNYFNYTDFATENWDAINVFNRNSMSVDSTPEKELRLSNVTNSHIYTGKTYTNFKLTAKVKSDNGDRLVVFIGASEENLDKGWANGDGGAKNGGVGILIRPDGANSFVRVFHPDNFSTQSPVQHEAVKITTNVTSFQGNYVTIEVTVIDNSVRVSFDGYTYCDYTLPNLPSGRCYYQGGHVGIALNNNAHIVRFSELSIQNYNDVSCDYSKLPDNYGPGIGLAYTNRGGSGTCYVNDGSLLLNNHANGNLYTTSSYSNVEVNFSYKSVTSGRIMLVFGNTDVTKGYSAGNNMGDGLLGLLISCPVSGGGFVRRWDNSGTFVDTSFPTSPDATTNYVPISIKISGTSLMVLVNGNKVVSLAISKPVILGKICVVRGENDTCTFSLEDISIKSAI